MSRISKDLATTISRKLTINFDNKIDELKKQLTECATEIALKRVPKEVLEFYEKYPKYGYTTTKIKIYGKGFNGQSYYVLKIPTNIDGSSHSGKSLQDLSENEAKKLMKLTNSFEELVKKRDSLRTSIYNALLQLMTYKRIIEQFPEAAPYLERKDAYAIAIPVEDIRKQLQEL